MSGTYIGLSYGLSDSVLFDSSPFGLLRPLRCRGMGCRIVTVVLGEMNASRVIRPD